MSTAVQDAPAATSAATGTETDEISQAGTSEATAASNGAPAEHTPTADDDELAEFKATVAKATGAEPADPETESKPDVNAPAKTDEPEAKQGEEEESAALSQEKVPDKLTERPEWQKLTAIADKAGKTEGKETRALLRGLFKREYDLNQAIEKAKPAQEVYQEMLKSVGGSEQGFQNMRQLVKEFDSDPAGSIPKLKILLDDAMKRAGLVLQSPELLTEAQELDQQFKDGVIDQTAHDKRKKELLELEQGRITQKRTQAQTQAEVDREKQSKGQQQMQAAVQVINSTEAVWTENKLKNDPDFEALQNLHATFTKDNALSFHSENGRLPSAKETNEILEKSFKQAKAEAAKFRPRPKARQAISGGANGSSGNNRQQPSSELDEFKAEVEAAQKRHGR